MKTVLDLYRNSNLVLRIAIGIVIGVLLGLLLPGVAGGSLLLVPMACSLFGISNGIAMQVVGVGFIISVIQDSVETALNSTSDVMFAATAEYSQWRKMGRPLPAS